jgi:hypothetical protein
VYNWPAFLVEPRVDRVVGVVGLVALLPPRSPLRLGVRGVAGADLFAELPFFGVPFFGVPFFPFLLSPAPST